MRVLRHYSNGALRLAYEKEGSGPVVIFMHGIGGNRTNWAEQQAGLGDRYCTVAWDARGYGDSDDPDKPLKFSDFADDLNTLLDHLGIRTAHLVGMSMGGMIAQDFYSRHADRVATLTLADTSRGFGAASEADRRDFLEPRLKPLQDGLTPADLAPNIVGVLAGPKVAEHVRQRLLESISAVRAGPYIQALKATVTTDFREILPTIDVPTLIIVGTDDKVLPVSESQILVNAIRGSELMLIEQAGHLTNIEAPGRFNAILGDFLDRHAGRATII